MRAASDRLGRLDYNCLKGNPCFIRRPLLGALLAELILFFFPLLGIKAAPEETIDPSLDERVIYVMGDPAHPAMLQVTTFYPDGSGPFPLAVINHSKAVGDSKNEPRYRSIFLSRYFLSRGYAVALPMMRGFAGSGGVFHFNRCDLEGLGLIAAADILEVIKVLSQQPHIDGSRVIVIGAGLGGWNTLATGTNSFPGIKALLIFSACLVRSSRRATCPCRFLLRRTLLRSTMLMPSQTQLPIPGSL